MSWESAWLVLVGVMFVGYLVLEGRSIGVGLILPLLGDSDANRRAVINTVGPFFLGNEVWIVSVVGLLVGGFPIFEGTLLSGLQPAFAVFVLGMVLRGVAFHFRQREEARRWRRGWEIVISAASLALALAWGVIGAAVLNTLPLSADGVLRPPMGLLLTPFVLACALTAVLVFALHGTCFAATRLSGPVAESAIRLARRLGPLALGGLLVSFVAGALTAPVRAAVQQTGAVLALEVAALVAVILCDVGSWRSSPRWSFLCTSLVLATAALVVGVGRLPYLLVSEFGDSASMTVREGAADPTVLAPLFWVVAAVIPVLLLSQFWAWRLFRAPVNAQARAYF